MARPIIPMGARRVSAGASVEILGKSGRWVPLHILGNSGRAAVYAKYRDRMVNGKFPEETFQWGDTTRQYVPGGDGQQNDGQQDGQGGQFGRTEHVGQDQQEQDDTPQDGGSGEGGDHRDDGTSDDQQDQQEQQDQHDQQPPTMEELVRRIAGELDRNWAHDVLGAVSDLLKEFQPETSGGIAKVEIKKAEQLEQHDGLFHHEFPTLVQLVSVGQHTYLPGPPGSGKSHAGKQVADVLGWKYVDISLSADMSETRLWGGRTPDGFLETPILDAIRHACANPDSGSVVLIDEMDAGRPGLLTSLNSTLANGRVTAPNGDVLEFGPNLVFLGAANTFGTGPTAEFSGRHKIDPATLDRFTYLPWDTDPTMEEAIVRSFLHDDTVAQTWLDAWRTLRANVQSYGIKFFVTMRGARNGARMIASGMDMHKVMMLVAGNKVPADQWTKVNPL